MEPFMYPNTLVEKVKLLAHKVTKKNGALVSSQQLLYRVNSTIDEANFSLDPARKRIEELEASLKESQEFVRRFRTIFMRYFLRTLICPRNM